MKRLLPRSSACTLRALPRLVSAALHLFAAVTPSTAELASNAKQTTRLNMIEKKNNNTTRGNWKERERRSEVRVNIANGSHERRLRPVTVCRVVFPCAPPSPVPPLFSFTVLASSPTCAPLGSGQLTSACFACDCRTAGCAAATVDHCDCSCSCVRRIREQQQSESAGCQRE